MPGAAGTTLLPAVHPCSAATAMVSGGVLGQAMKIIHHTSADGVVLHFKRSYRVCLNEAYLDISF